MTVLPEKIPGADPDSDRISIRTVRKRRYELLSVLAVLVVLAFFIMPPIIKRGDYQQITGTVVGLGKTGIYPKSREKAKGKLFPIIQYEVNSDTFTYQFPTEVLFKKFDLGDEVKMIYLRETPSVAHIDSFFGYWFPVNRIIMFLLFAVAAAGFVGAAALIFEPGYR